MPDEVLRPRGVSRARASSPRFPLAVALLVALLAGGFTYAGMQSSDPGWNANRVFLLPSIIGYLLVGGVHGGASMTMIDVAAALANGVVWGGVAFWAARILVWLLVRPDTP